jgi:hypothetical protein
MYELDKLEQVWIDRVKKGLNPVTGQPEKINPEKFKVITRKEYEQKLNSCSPNFGTWLKKNEPEKFEIEFKKYKQEIRNK